MKQQPHSKKSEAINTWKDYGQCFYDFMFENLSDWPVTSLQWGPIQQSSSQSILQRLYFSCRTDGIYNSLQNTWQNIPNIIIMATVELPNEDHYFINDLKSLFNPDAAKKHPNMKIKQIISHPGQVTVIRTSPINKKILASKNDCNEVYLWTSDRYKMSNSNYPSNPDLSLDATKSQKANYALRFAPSLPRLITASGDKIQLFDIENSGPTKRQLGSVMNPNSIKPFLTLTGHDKVQDFAFKNNEVWVSGGQDKQIGLWDFRMKCVTNKIKNIHENDINSVSFQGNYILSGGEQGRINIIDDRKLSVVYKKQTQKPVHSISFHQANPFFAVGNDKLSIYSLDKIQQTDNFDPIFIHHGINTSINQFDWNQQHPMTLAVTCQQMDPENPLHGGLIHIFKPNDIFSCSKDDALHKIEQAYKKLSSQERQRLDQSL